MDNSGVAGVDIYRAPWPGEPVQSNGLIFLGEATLVEGARPDVASTYPSYPGTTRAGWGYQLLTNMLPNQGNGRFTISAFVRTVDGATAPLGSRTVVGANTTNRKPFGTIDTPAQGQTVSGTIVNFGWALTPQPNTIPVDGSTITVYIDGQPVGHPTYNNFRADIAALFPGYANTSGAIGLFHLDTTTLGNGVHTIAWGVVDSAGNAEGIGSRFFTVSNPASNSQHVNELSTEGGVFDTTGPASPTVLATHTGEVTQAASPKYSSDVAMMVIGSRASALSNPAAAGNVEVSGELLSSLESLRERSGPRFETDSGIASDHPIPVNPNIGLPARAPSATAPGQITIHGKLRLFYEAGQGDGVWLTAGTAAAVWLRENYTETFDTRTEPLVLRFNQGAGGQGPAHVKVEALTDVLWRISVGEMDGDMYRLTLLLQKL